jgi:multiple antibiotic resistance protein
VFLAWLGAGLVILAGNRLASVLGKRGLAATERLMGMVLVAISVEMLMRGVSAFLAAQGGAAARGG